MEKFGKIKTHRLGATNHKQLCRQQKHGECCNHKLANCHHIENDVSVKRISGKHDK